MSSGSVAGAGEFRYRKSDSPGGEGASCGTCHRVDNSRMVQCDECDVWYHYDCVNVDDSIRNHDWSCNGCMRTALEKQKRTLNEQLERFEQHQRQWQLEQQKRLDQMEEQQKLEQRQNIEMQQRKQEQIVRSQLGALQLQQPNLSSEAATTELEVPSKSYGVIPKQHRQPVRIAEKTTLEGIAVDIQRNTEVFANSTANNVKTPARVDKASSRSSKRSAKLRELEVRALEARQALEKKQLEERLAMEREMLEFTDSEAESVTSLEKINEWLEKTENIGQGTGSYLDDSPLPVYDEILRKPATSSIQPGLLSNCVPVGSSTRQQPVAETIFCQPRVVPQQTDTSPARGTCPPHTRSGVNIPRVSAHYQSVLGTYQAPVASAPPAPLYTVASQQPIMSTTYPAVHYPHLVSQNVVSSQAIGQPPLLTSTPRQNVASYQQQINCDSIPLTSSHLAARQTVKDLPKFGGDPEDWPRFIAAYERTSRMCAFRNDELLDRLERSLHDKALNAVKSLLLHPDNVPVIVNRLKTLFGNPESIVETMVQRIRAMPSPKTDKMETIVDFGVAVQNLCATIQVCQMDERFYNVALMQELVESLPSPLKIKWAFYRKETGAVTLLHFNAWLGEMVEALCQVIRPAVRAKPEHKSDRKVRREDAFVHAHSSHIPEQVDHHNCLACGNECSSLDNCSRFLNMSANQRWALVNEKKICRKCLIKHLKACDRKVPCGQNGCSFLHHRLLHDDSKHNKPSSCMSTQDVSVNAHHRLQGRVLLKYVQVTVYGRGKAINTYAFLDAGSTSTLMEHSLWEELNLKGEKSPLCISWTGGQGRYEKDSVVFRAEISGAKTPGQIFHLAEVHTVRSLDLPAQTMFVPDLAKHFQHLSGLPIESYDDVKPRILLGIDNCRLEYPLDSREGFENQPTAVLTRLGWMVYGPCSTSAQTTEKKDVSYGYHICQCEGLHSAVKNYFSMDSLGVQLSEKPQISRDDERAMDLLRTNTTFHDGRYETCLLWRYDEVRLPESKAMALKRHDCLSKRMAREPRLAKELQEKIQDYQVKGYIRKLSAQEEASHAGRSWYLPIFPVVNPNKPGKLRIVWDAAAKVGKLSLNSFLLKGPDQVTPLHQVLQRFREFRTAVTGDIREMFHQVRINSEDQHYQRFLWNDGVPGKVPSTYVMEVMTFGACCSPSSAQYVKNLNAERFRKQLPNAVDAICKGTYVDDMLCSVETEAEAVRLAQDVRQIHAEGGFEIRGWLSNSKEVVESMGEQRLNQKDLNKDGELSTEKVLGMWWNTIDDTFTFMIPKRCRQELLSGIQVPTKREVLKILMSVYDPLGLLANVLMFLKVLLQNIWRSNIGWDEPISDQHLEKWRAWLSVLHSVHTVCVPRCYRTTTSSSVESNELQLHVFVDASENGYAAVVYFRFAERGTVECAFVTAKTRVAPLKYVSIPRLELQAAVIGTRLAKDVGETHRIPINKRFFWTDSRDVLCWLRSDHRKYSKFVAARTGEILENTELSEWFWIPTKQNVADEGTKWQKTPDLSPSCRWLEGQISCGNSIVSGRLSRRVTRLPLPR